MSNNIPKIYSKIKNFTEKDQVRVKYSYIGKDKKLMLSVYIGEDVYNELTNGQTFKRLKVEYIPNDMVIITPTNEEKEGIVHRYNGKGLFKTTCVRLSLSSYKKLKISKKDFNNRVVEYNIKKDTANICGSDRLMVDLIGNNKRRSKFINKRLLPDYRTTIFDQLQPDIVPQDYVSNSKIKPLESIAPIQYPYNCDSRILDYTMGEGCVTHDCLNNVRDTIENRLLGIEEQFEKRIQEIESLLKPSREDIYNNFKGVKEELEKKIFDLEEQFVKRILMQEEYYAQKLDRVYKVNDELIKLKRPNENTESDINTFKQLFDKSNDVMNFRLSKIESLLNGNSLDIVKDSINAMGKEIVELNTKLFNIESKINVLLQKAEFKNYHENKSLMEKIFGKD